MHQDIAIKAENVSKHFRIGELDEAPDSLGGTILKALKNPLDNYRKYRSLYRFDDLQRGGAEGPSDVIWAVRDVSFEVPRGQVMGIIGSNGAGKSTLLKILSNITPPSEGRITIHGRVSSLLEVGTGFHQELTGRENVYLNGTIMGMRRREIAKKFDQIVEFSGVEKFLDTPVKRYSSGMRVRLAFAVAAHLEPEILIIDEVLAVGDAAFQRKCLDKMEDVGQHGRTVLFVSHNMPAVTRLCTRALMLKEGRLVMDGSATEVVGAYLNDGEGLLGTREWRELASAPGDEVVKLLRLSITNERSEVVKSVEVQEAVGLEMEYEVLEGGRPLMPYFVAWTEEGVRMFTAPDTDPRWLNRPRPPGRYATTAWIPGNLLNEGMIYVSAHMRTLAPAQLHFHVHQQIAFQVVDSMKPGGARGAWVGNLGGAVRPVLQWETKSLSSGDGLAAAGS